MCIHEYACPLLGGLSSFGVSFFTVYSSSTFVICRQYHKRNLEDQQKFPELWYMFCVTEPKVEVPLFIQQLVSACEDDDVASPEDVVAVLKGAGLKDVGVALVSSDDVVETILERAGLGDSGAVLEGAGLEVKGSADMEGAEVKVKSSAADHSALEQLNKTWNGDTVLHTASINGCSSLIPILLQYGANPTVKNDSGHTPYLVARNKDVRDSFRRFMASSPEAYDYERAYIPSPLTTDMELERSRKEAEKRKEKKKVRKQKAKVWVHNQK